MNYLDMLELINEVYEDLKELNLADNDMELTLLYSNGLLDEHDWQIVKMRAKLYEWVQNDVNKQEEERYANNIHGRNKQRNKS